MRRLLPTLATGIAALAAPGIVHAAPIARPNPILVSTQVDYVNPLRSASGGIASLAPLEQAVIEQAVSDQQYLAYQQRGDLGGFAPAPVGRHALVGNGRAIVGTARPPTQIPQFSLSGSGTIQAFAPTGGATGPPDNGTTPLPGLGTPPAIVPPTNNNTVPPPNQGFGGKPSPGTTTTPGTTTSPQPGTTTTTPTTTTRPPPTTTTAPPTTTTTTTTTTTPTTTTAPTTTTTPPPTTTTPPPSSSCGTAGLSIVIDNATCRLYAVNMAPGDSVTEHATITNTSDQTFDLSMRASGVTNRLWDDLQLGVWPVNTAAPSPLPGLLLWTTQYNALTTLAPGQSITYVIELYLPQSAGNADQGLTATIDFNWKATGS